MSPRTGPGRRSGLAARPRDGRRGRWVRRGGERSQARYAEDGPVVVAAQRAGNLCHTPTPRGVSPGRAWCSGYVGSDVPSGKAPGPLGGTRRLVSGKRVGTARRGRGVTGATGPPPPCARPVARPPGQDDGGAHGAPLSGRCDGDPGGGPPSAPSVGAIAFTRKIAPHFRHRLRRMETTPEGAGTGRTVDGGTPRRTAERRTAW